MIVTSCTSTAVLLIIGKPFDILSACNFWLWDWNITVKLWTTDSVILIWVLYWQESVLLLVTMGIHIRRFVLNYWQCEELKTRMIFMPKIRNSFENQYSDTPFLWGLYDQYVDILLIHIYHKVLSQYIMSFCCRRIFTTLQSIPCGNLIHMRYLQCYLMNLIWYLHICQLRVIMWWLIILLFKHQVSENPFSPHWSTI